MKVHRRFKVDIFLILFLIVFSVENVNTSVCDYPSGWLPSGSHFCMWVSTESSQSNLSWEEAKRSCSIVHSMASLASLSTDQNDISLVRRIKLSTPYWVGLKIPFHQRVSYHWLDGSPDMRPSPLTLAVSPHLPQSTSGDVCVQVTLTVSNMHPHLTWTLDDCSLQYPYVCLFDHTKALITTVPATTTIAMKVASTSLSFQPSASTSTSTATNASTLKATITSSVSKKFATTAAFKTSSSTALTPRFTQATATATAPQSTQTSPRQSTAILFTTTASTLQRTTSQLTKAPTSSTSRGTSATKAVPATTTTNTATLTSVMFQSTTSAASSDTQTIVLQCWIPSVWNCLLSSEQTLRGIMQRDAALQRANQLLENIQSFLNSMTNIDYRQLLKEFFLVTDAVLDACNNFTTMSERVLSLLCKQERFLDDLMAKADPNIFHSEFFMKLHNIEVIMRQIPVTSVIGHQIRHNGFSVQLHSMDTIHDGKANPTGNAVLSVIVLRVPRTRVYISESLISNMATPTLNAEVVSPVLALSLYSDYRRHNVSHSFKLHLAENINEMSTCGFQTHDQRVDVWSARGCELHPSNTTKQTTSATNCVQGSNKGDNCGQQERRASEVTECRCNHTTNFAILMKIVDFELDVAHELALSIITYIGSSITLITQVMAITVFTCVRSLNSERVCVHRNLCVSILCVQVTFISGIKAVQTKLICGVVAVLLHYFTLASFVWMLVEGLHLYSKVVTVFGNEKSRIYYYTTFGWGLPLVLVTISAAVDWKGYGTEHSCWLSVDRSTVWAFVGPALSVIIVNIIILILVLKILVGSAKVDKHDGLHYVRAGIKGSLFLCPLLGITWLFGLAAVSRDMIAFQYIFAVLNSLQGFFVFLFHCVLNTEVRQTLIRMRVRRSLQKGDFSTTSNGRLSYSESHSPTESPMTIDESPPPTSFCKGNQVAPSTKGIDRNVVNDDDSSKEWGYIQRSGKGLDQDTTDTISLMYI